MKLADILYESITFVPCVYVPHKDGQYLSSEPFEKKVKKQCWVCHGSGMDPHDPDHKHPCEYCEGKKETDEVETEYPEMNVANGNAYEILAMLGLKPDSDGMVPSAQLPDLRRKLIVLKNKGYDQHTLEPSQTRDVRVARDENNLPQIGRGPLIISPGRSHEQVTRYIDKLLAIIDFAQKHNAVLCWH